MGQTLRRIALRAHREAQPKLDPKPYQSKCPAGYQTVIGWFTAQGLETEDMGCRAGIWAWKQKQGEAIKVRAPVALEGVAEWVYAYPVAWLEDSRADLMKRKAGR